MISPDRTSFQELYQAGKRSLEVVRLWHYEGSDFSMHRNFHKSSRLVWGWLRR